MNMLEVRGLVVGYGKVAVLRDARLDVGSGRIVTVIGPNGAGKTTLLAALMGLLPARGSVRYDAENLADLAVEARVRRGMCLVPERRELFGDLPVEDNLRLGAFSRSRRDRKVEDDLAAVYARFPRLHERRAQLARTLSGGERQMLALGRALMARPKLLMLDEPSLGLAPRIARDIFHVIAGLRETGVSILLVEQNARAALQIADYGYVLEMGEFVLEGAAAELAANPRVIETVNKGLIHIEEPDLDAVVQVAVAKGLLRATSKPKPADIFVIAVPTPFNDGKPDVSYAMDYFVATVVALLDAKGIERAHLVGHSMGGHIATLFALTHPTRIDRLVLVDPAGVQRAPTRRSARMSALAPGPSCFTAPARAGSGPARHSPTPSSCRRSSGRARSRAGR